MPLALCDTPLAVGWFANQLSPPEHSMTLIVKGTFRLSPGTPAAIVAPADQIGLTGDQPTHDDGPASLRYASDFAPFKPRADLLFAGRCHVPDQRPTTLCEVTFGVGDTQRSLAIIGDRTWKKSILSGWKPTEPTPFTELDLTFEHSFGAPDNSANPVGKGFGGKGFGGKQAGRPLPNIEDPAAFVRTPHDKILPVGFGPLGTLWSPRDQNLGTYDANWLAERWPWFPADFDWQHFNAAQPAMQVDYLRGDESLRFVNLHRDHQEFRSALPGLRVRGFLNERQGELEVFREVSLCLDTLFVDMEQETLVLLWRGITPVQTKDLSEITHVYIATEELAAASETPEWHQEQFQQLIAPPPQPDPEAAIEVAEPAGFAPQDEIAKQMAMHEKALDEAMQKDLGEVREVLEKAGAPAALLAALDGESDPKACLDKLLGSVGVAPDQADDYLAQLAEHNKREYTKLGLDPSIFDQEIVLEPAEAPPFEPSRAAVEGRYAAGEGFEDLDLSGLDLSGLDLHGADFTRAKLVATDLRSATLTDAILSAANLDRAKFDDAKLDGAFLDQAAGEGTSFCRADLRGCFAQDLCLGQSELQAADFTGSDLTDASITASNLGGARLQQTILEGCVLTATQFEGVDAVGADFRRSDCTQADFQTADLSMANFTGARLDAVEMRDAKLNQAILEGAEGIGTCFAGADLTELRASEATSLPDADFTRVTAERSNWMDADLSGAAFTRAKLDGADFSRAKLQRADLDRTELSHSNLTQADLTDATVLGANLFASKLESAILQNTDFTAANLYGSEFLDAQLDGCVFDGANLKMTKLAGKASRKV